MKAKLSKKEKKVDNKKQRKNNTRCLNRKIKPINNDNNNDTNNDNNKKEIKKLDIHFYKFIDERINDQGNFDNFCVFKSIDNILNFVYGMQSNIIFYNLIDNKKIIEIKKAYDKYIYCFYYFFDKNNKRDLIISNNYSNIKLWNANNFQCIINLKNTFKTLDFSANFGYNGSNIYIITGFFKDYYNFNDESFYENIETIKVYDLNGNKIKGIKNYEYNYYIYSYFDIKSYQSYIITGNKGFVLSYDFENNYMHKKFCELDDNEIHGAINMYNKEEKIYLIESNNKGKIRIWNFETGEFKQKINSYNDKLCCNCLLDNDNLLVGWGDKSLKIIDLNNGKIIKTIVGHRSNIISIKKVEYPKYGEIIISQGANPFLSRFKEKLKIWIINKD